MPQYLHETSPIQWTEEKTFEADTFHDSMENDEEEEDFYDDDDEEPALKRRKIEITQ